MEVLLSATIEGRRSFVFMKSFCWVDLFSRVRVLKRDMVYKKLQVEACCGVCSRRVLKEMAGVLSFLFVCPFLLNVAAFV